MAPSLTIVVCAYDMARELPRTIHTLSAQGQRGLGEHDHAIVVLDNGSPMPVDARALAEIHPGTRVVRVEEASRSPARAINRVMEEIESDLVGLWIDGARMASPGIVSLAREALGRDAGRIVGTLAFHLGPEVQMLSTLRGYDQKVEDALLATIDWRRDGYALFDVSALAGSSAEGWFGCLAESNGVFFDRGFWRRLGGFDERFEAAGGGLVNLDFWRRAMAASSFGPWMLLGEGTFHQVHGGAATNGAEADRLAMWEEYEALFGRPFEAARYRPQFLGSLDARRFAAGSPRPAT